ncbi:MAG TPA: hypothetical protein DCL21_03260 [Alphaproteobacteria bacterium]|nr:hypothetical protein [Alphaproteobacteria bacterium]
MISILSTEAVTLIAGKQSEASKLFLVNQKYAIDEYFKKHNKLPEKSAQVALVDSYIYYMHNVANVYKQLAESLAKDISSFDIPSVQSVFR